MIRSIVGVSVVLVLAGCETTLDGGDDLGEGGASGSGSEQTGDIGTSADSVGPVTNAVTVVGAGSSGSGEPVVCPSLDGIPPVDLIHDEPGHLSGLVISDDTIAYSTPEHFVRLSQDPPGVLEDATVPWIHFLLEENGMLFGAGNCISGGNPYVISAGPTFDAVAGCGEREIMSLVPVAGGVAFAEIVNDVRWAPMDGDGASILLGSVEPIGDEMTALGGLATDGTNIFVGVTRIGSGTSSGEVWRFSTADEPPVRLVAMEPIPAWGNVYSGGIYSVFVDDGFVYFAELGSGRVCRVSTSGGDVEVLFDGDQAVLELIEVGPDLAFIDMTAPFTEPKVCTPVLRMMPKTGGEAAIVAVLPEYPERMATDGTSIFVSGFRETGSEDEEMGIFRTPAVRP